MCVCVCVPLAREFYPVNQIASALSKRNKGYCEVGQCLDKFTGQRGIALSVMSTLGEHLKFVS